MQMNTRALSSIGIADAVDDGANYSCSDGRGFQVIQEPEVLRLAEYWRSKRAGRPMPSRRDIDPLEIPWALSRIFLVDYEAGTGDYRYRVAGEDIEEVFRRFTGSISLRGVTLRQALPPASVDAVHRRWSPLPTKGHIVYMRGLVYLAAERVPVGARILLPLSERGDGTVTGLIGITVCDWLRPTEVNCPPGVDVHYIPVADLDTVASPGAATGP
jgi:hypothetical protein